MKYRIRKKMSRCYPYDTFYHVEKLVWHGWKYINLFMKLEDASSWLMTHLVEKIERRTAKKKFKEETVYEMEV